MSNSHIRGRLINLRRVAAWAAFLAIALLAVNAVSAQDNDSLPNLGQGGLFGNAGMGGDNDAITVKACFTLSDAKPADANSPRDGWLFVTADISAGWHIYSLTQKSGSLIATTITPEQSGDYKLTGPFTTSSEPKRETVAALGNIVVETREGTVTWRAPLQIAAGVDPKTLQIKGVLYAQSCSKNSCLPPKTYPFTASFSQEPPATAAAFTTQETQAAGQSGGANAFAPGELKVAANEDLANKPVLAILALAFAGGLILNIMPCVLPVIGLKLLSFVEQSGQSRARAFMLNFWYSLGLMSVFMVLATLAVAVGIGWGGLFQYNGFTITLTAIVFVMALSLFGVWEIPIPGFAGRGKANELSQREGPGGAFAKGILTTFLATPCSAPLLAPALAWTTTRWWPEVYLVFFCVGLGMAAPYLLIGAFPRLIRFLPKPGAWMETFKHIMGFVLLGTVVYLLTTLHQSHPVPAIALLFGLWGVCWWIGRTPHTADGSTKIRRWMIAAILVIALIIIAYPGTDEIIPEWVAVRGIGPSFSGLHDVMDYRLERLVAQRLAKAGSLPAKKTSAEEIVWIPFTQPVLEMLVGPRRTVLVDFTADWCATCKTLETTELDTPAVRKALVEHNIVTMQADCSREDSDNTKMLNNLGSKQVPVIAIFPADRPNQPVVLRGGYTSGQLIAAIEEATAGQ